MILRRSGGVSWICAGPPGGASGAAPGALRAPGSGVQRRSKNAARSVRSLCLGRLFFLKKGVASQSRVFTGHICSKFFSMTMISCPSEDEVGPTECVAGKCICKEGLYYVCHERRDNSTWSGCSKECKCQQQRPVDGCTPIAALASARADSLQI
ncbi:unnamed protein product [Prorocentrum cordatum]|uniref:Uncharacterized protein n=1 Tax=Prorocentrum cordatum TaxID=2364126 RepID=A0ABN9SFH2_9DINO|nr:unnamed protein product [Polarella glacialis]